MDRTVTSYMLTAIVFCLAASSAEAHKAHHPWFSHHTETEVATEKPVIARSEAPKQSVNDNDGSPRSRQSLAMTPGERPQESTTATSKDDGQKIVQQAMRYKGSRYKFGGNSRFKGFDCSGLIERVYNDLKLKQVPHTSSALYHEGKPVKLSELRPGDLVFFKNTYRLGISHVGIYAGHNEFIHARNHHYGVVISPLSDPYYQLHYAGARRLY